MVEYEDAEWNIDYDGEDFNIPLGNVQLLGQTWKPQNDPKFVYVFVHGLAVFATFKKDFFQVILNMDGVVYACDHLGHGRSPGARVSCRIDEIVEETMKTIELAHKTYPNLPIVLHGHSMGGLTVLKLVMKNNQFVRDNLECVIAEAPWISRCPQRPVNCCLMGFLRMFDSCCCSTSQFDGGVSHFSDDLNQEWVSIMKKSPYMGTTITPRLYVSVNDSIKYVQDTQTDFPRDVPLLFLQGMNDDLVDGKESDGWIKELMGMGDHKIIYKSFKKGPHVMLKTKLRGQVIKEMLEFMKMYLPGLEIPGESNEDNNQEEEQNEK
ncbi:Clan SC, family S33, methylesterase-like serine peptidase [Tritrichomonas foetus]|uniref:Clan SC, family S33, methylesterase-like serine peptidase n=1 Tax=Tritrichomonas foetus TaxID=1144522 RepID=A0A1J4JNF8_9EUKA|nr:Clan SC, family S33, methylesterase-like serine peptidase [Tritrichomonas foetus]|eukprot:OHS98796.1 Clan SC, family S33, methylesterase-like serine peptidase [Tritrichomonas foetus]